MTASANGVIATRRVRRPGIDHSDLTSLQRPAAERAALAAMVLAIDAQPAKVADIAAGLEAAMFSDSTHAEMMAGIHEAIRDQRPGVAAVAAAIRRRAAEDGIDVHRGGQLLAELLDEWVGPDACRAAELAAAEIRDAHGRRLAALAMSDGLERMRAGQVTATDLHELATVLERAREAIEPATREGTGLVNILDHWSRAESDPVVRTMFGPLDRRLGGGLPIGLTGIAARPGDGKSALAGQLTLGSLLADRAARAVWFRGEMTNDLLAGKMLATWSSLRGDAAALATFKDARRRSPAARAVAVDLASVVGDRLVVVDPPLTPEGMEAEIRRHRPQLAVVDYLQLCESGGKADRRAEIEHVTRSLARMATAYSVAIIVVSAVAKTTSEASGIGALAKDSNLLDYDVHTFLTLWGEGDREADPREIRLKIEKSRTGVPGDVALHFSGSGQFFSPADAELADDPTFYAEFADYDPGALA
jgi:replicative DNA helicase